MAKLPSFDRCDLEHSALGCRETVDPCREQRLDRRRDDELRALLRAAVQRQQLLEEEGVSVRRVDDAAEVVGGEVALGAQMLGERDRLVVGEGCQHGENGVRSRRRPRRPFLEQLGPRQAQDDDPRPAREARDVLQQVEQRRLGPVDVVDDEDERSLACKRLEESSKRPGGLFAGTADRVRSERAGNAVRDRLSTLVVRHQLQNGCACIRAEDGPERLRERQEGDAFPVRGAAPDQHADRVAELGQELPRQP